jgi:hypothetical protein
VTMPNDDEPKVFDRRGQAPQESQEPPMPPPPATVPETYVIRVEVSKNFAKLNVMTPAELNPHQVQMILARAAKYYDDMLAAALVVQTLRDSRGTV